MQNNSPILDVIFLNTQIKDEDRVKFALTYLTLIFKETLELFISLLGNNEDFAKAFESFYSSAYDKLSEDQKNAFDVTLDVRKKEIAIEMVKKMQENATDELKKTLEDNLKALEP